MQIVFSPAARRVLVEIGRFIATDNPSRAESFVDEAWSMVRATTNPCCGRIAGGGERWSIRV